MKKHFITLLICGMFGYASAQSYSQSYSEVFQHVDLSHDSSSARLSQHNLIGYQMDNDSTGIYKFGVGLSLNTIGSAYTIKYRISNKCAFQTDLGVKYFINLVKGDDGISPVMLILLDVSQNFLYHHRVATKENKSFNFLLGAGVSGGLTPYGPVTWKAGANPLVGLEIVLKKTDIVFPDRSSSWICRIV